MSKKVNKEPKRRIKTSQQEKYEFLMSTIGKSGHELKNMIMRNGMTYAEARSYVQLEYNRGTLNLEPEQIEQLKNNGILNYTSKEKQEIMEKFGVLEKYALDIEKKYGSYEVFLENFKKHEINYDFGNDVFVGYRGIVLSERELTQAQKLGYSKLLVEIYGEDANQMGIDTYIDADKIEKALSTLSFQQAEILRLRFGLIDGKKYTFDELGEKYGISNQNIKQKENRGLRILRSPEMQDVIFGEKRFDGTVNAELIKEDGIETQYEKLKEKKKAISAIKKYITCSDSTLKTKEEITDIDLSELGIDENFSISTHFLTNYKPKTMYELIASSYNRDPNNAKSMKNEEYEKDLMIGELKLSTRTTNILRDSGILTVQKLIQMTEEELQQISELGRKGYTEIKEKIDEMGLEFAKKDTEHEEKQQDKIISKNTSIKDLNFKNRTCFVLLRSGIRNVEDLLKLSGENYEYIRNAGPKTYAEVKEKIEELESILEKNTELEEQVYKDVGDNPIENLYLTGRSFFCLKRVGINTINEFEDLSEDDSRLKKLGKKGYKEVKEKIEEFKKIEQRKRRNFKTDNEDYKQKHEQDEKKVGDKKEGTVQDLLQYCDDFLTKFEIVEENKRRYLEAKKNYLEVEDIFDPNGIVPAVLKRKEEKSQDKHEVVNADVEKPVNANNENIQTLSEEELINPYEELQSETNETKRKIEEEKRKAEIIASIKKHQQELEKLKAELDKIEKKQDKGLD